MAIEPDPKTAARIAALQEEMDAIHQCQSHKGKAVPIMPNSA
jgi:hypothetical protein